MKKYKLLYPNEYNSIRSAGLANSLAVLFGVEPLSEETADIFVDLVNCAKRADKALIYCPLSLAEWVLNENVETRNELLSVAPLSISCVSDPIGKKEYGFLTMLTGKAISSKDVKKGILEVDTIFDALKKTKKRVLLISSFSNSKNNFFKGKAVDVIKVKSGAESVNYALKSIKENIYDIIILIDSDYDDCIRIGLPLSKGAKKTVKEQASRFCVLNDATEVFWKGDILTGFCPDKGCRRGLFIGRTLGISAADLNVTHFYGIKSND